MTVVEDVVKKYNVDGEETPPVSVDAHLSALTDNPDGSVTVSLLATKISASATTKFSTPYGEKGEFFTNLGTTPSGEWPIRFTLKNREIAESLRGLAEVGGEKIRLISDMHRIVMNIQSEETGGKTPNEKTRREFNR